MLKLQGVDGIRWFYFLWLRFEKALKVNKRVVGCALVTWGGESGRCVWGRSRGGGGSETLLIEFHVKKESEGFTFFGLVIKRHPGLKEAVCVVYWSRGGDRRVCVCAGWVEGGWWQSEYGLLKLQGIGGSAGLYFLWLGYKKASGVDKCVVRCVLVT